MYFIESRSNPGALAAWGVSMGTCSKSRRSRPVQWENNSRGEKEVDYPMFMKESNPKNKYE